jgi:hypothetical protein
VLEAYEDGKRAGMVMTTADVRALVDQVTYLRRRLAECVGWAELAHLALLDHDLPKCRRLLDDMRSAAC